VTAANSVYTPRREAQSEWLDVHGLRLHVRRWANEGAPQLFLIHGWMDASASFQFVVDALAAEWDVIAPDLRGFGESEWDESGYFFAQYLADLDALLERYSPDAPARLVGHSLGGNIVCVYAGVRPQRVAALANLDAFGLRDAAPEEAPLRLEKWLAQLRSPERHRTHPDTGSLVTQLRLENPRLSRERALFIAAHLGEEDGIGGVVRAADPAHKHVSPVLYRFPEIAAAWRRVIAPVLIVRAGDDAVAKRVGVSEEEIRRRFECFPQARIETLENSGHNLHLEQPERVAALLEAFFASAA
jgi:pimeloyl-ACP methyl ester carboxylesterase